MWNLLQKKGAALGLGAALALSLISCSTATESSDNVNPKRIYQSYMASYDAGINQTFLRAQFRFGGVTGTTLVLEGKANVISSASLSKQDFLGTSYVGRNKNFSEKHTFTFTDPSGKVFENSAKMIPIAFQNPPKTISLSRPSTIGWTGPPAAANDTLDLILYYNNGVTITRLSTKRGTNASTVENLSLVKAGAQTMSLKRTRRSQLQQQESIGGDFTTSYTSARVAIQVIQ